MKAIQLNSFGTQGITVAEHTEPRIGGGEVLMRVRAASLNYRDLGMVEGIYAWKPPLPFVVMSDVAGEVIDTGSDVTQFAKGDRVASVFHPDWLTGPPTPEAVSTNLAGTYPGVGSELAKFPQRGLVKVPRHLSFAEASTLPVAGLTAWTALVETGGVRAGETVLIEGTGGVSIFALQFAVMAGAVAIVLSSAEDKLAKARELGAAHTINYKTNPQWAAKVLELTGGRGVDHVVEVAGHATFGQALEALAIGGHLVVIGFLGGSKSEIDLRRLMNKSARVEGVSVGSRQGFLNMNAAVEATKLRPVIDKVFPLKDAAKAFEYLKAAGHLGKIVVEF